MKRLFIILSLLFFLSPIFAKTVQCIKKYQVLSDFHGTTADLSDITPYIQYMINSGWRVVSITPVVKGVGGSTSTDHIIVLYEKEEDTPHK